MTLHSPTKNSLAVLNHKILEANSQVQNVKLGGHQTCLSINRLWHELCDMLRRLVGTTAPGHHDCSIQELKNVPFAVRQVSKWDIHFSGVAPSSGSSHYQIWNLELNFNSRKMKRGEEDQISSSINHIKNLTSLTSSKYSEIKRASHVVRMEEDHTTKRVFNAQQIGTLRKGRTNLRWINGLEKDPLVLRTKNWRTLAGRRLA
ncbi:uncharacterized protein TNCV_1424131 [Trichonephila clavipes]|nr:uncharacterized protein TNCV_1424131 [Trichonephila clavipes]